MGNIQEPKELDLTPLNKFFIDQISPTELAKILDEFLFEYINFLVRHLYTGDFEGVHFKTHQFVYYLRTLQDILPECKKV